MLCRLRHVEFRDIADAHGIPSRLLVQILLQLKGAGLVQSTRGVTGGYALAKPPEAISLAEVMAPLLTAQLKAPRKSKATSPAQPRHLALQLVWPAKSPTPSAPCSKAQKDFPPRIPARGAPRRRDVTY